VRDVYTTIDCSFEGAKNTSSSARSGQSDVQISSEGVRAVLDRLNRKLFGRHFGATFVQSVKT
jgi:hypothetical protein